MEHITPLFDQVLVQMQKAPEKTEHGLYTADDGKAKTDRGIVLSVGPGSIRDNGMLVPPSVRVGDTVLLGRMHSGQPLKINGEDGYLLITERDLIATVSEKLTIDRGE